MAKNNGSTQSRSRDNSERNGNGSNRPWTELRSGMLKATVWENSTSTGGTYFTTQLVRLYQDQNEEWQDTHGLGRDDLLRAANLLRRAFDEIEEEEQSRRESSRG
ncbi:MAG: hypothetical protein ACF8MF_04925 [Phycisphaerales bacterium JB052]